MMRELFGILRNRVCDGSLQDAGWRELLASSDRTQLTLHLRGVAGLPRWLEEEIEARYARNAQRRSRLLNAYAEAAGAFDAAGIEYILLKGFTHEACSGIQGARRVQYDLDLLIQPAELPRARQALARLGYGPHGSASLSEEHSRPMVQPSAWSWRGDYYDPEMPIPIELHASMWSPERDRIPAQGMEEFWRRRCVVEVHGLRIPSLAEPDRVTFAALHALRHILRHDARPAHVFELAQLLRARTADAVFWQRCLDLHPAKLQALAGVAFRFAHEWFGCPLPPGVVGTELAVEGWFQNFAWSPLANLSGRNKDTVWLHLALLDSWWDRTCVFHDRMLPLRLPRHERFLSRLRYHACALAPALASGVRWWRDTASTTSAISDWKRRRV